MSRLRIVTHAAATEFFSHLPPAVEVAAAAAANNSLAAKRAAADSLTRRVVIGRRRPVARRPPPPRPYCFAGRADGAAPANWRRTSRCAARVTLSLRVQLAAAALRYANHTLKWPAPVS